MLLLFKSGGHKQQLTLSHASLRLLLEYLPGGHACSTPPIFVVVVFRCGISHSHLLNIFFEEEENFFFEKNFFKRDTKKKKKNASHLHKKARVSSKALCLRTKRRGVRKKNIKNEIVLRAFFSCRRVLFLSLSLFCFCEHCTHILVFPGKISNFKKRTKHVRNAKE